MADRNGGSGPLLKVPAQPGHHNSYLLSHNFYLN